MSHIAVPELLCPAGNLAALHAAVNCGADAVYLGYQSFGARASAINFDAETLEEAVRFAHFHHVRVHVTVNTLVKQCELAAVNEALSVVSKCGVDALLVQDIGVARIAKELYPSLQLHASTQMALCNANGVQFAKDFGFDRVVLARECSLDDIAFASKVGIETEVFVHGALCSAVSGRCLMSSMAGGRSGNRGRCAQPCRQQLQLGNTQGALLSTKDLCLIDDLPTLIDAGVDSIKIEGRLKSAEYVAVVTTAYRRALDQIASGTFTPRDPKVKEDLMQIYNRGGFTRGHAMGEEDFSLCATDRSSHDGLPMGTVLSQQGNLAMIQTIRDLNDSDTLQIRSEEEDIDLRYSGHDVMAGEIATVRLRPDVSCKQGDTVSRLSDAKQLLIARSHQPKRCAVTMKAMFEAGQPQTLTLSEGISTVTVEGAIIAQAQKRAATPDDVRKQLIKLGDTPLCLNDPGDLQIDIIGDVFLPVSELNALRRAAAQQLVQLRIDTFREARKPSASMLSNKNVAHATSPISVNSLAVITTDLHLLADLKSAGATLVIYEPQTFTPQALDADLANIAQGAWLRLPPQIAEQTLTGALTVIAKHQEKLGGLMIESVGQLSLPTTLPIIAGEGIPITNKEGLAFFQATKASGFVLWPEWTKSEQADIEANSVPHLMTVYGRESLMLLNHCPERVARGLTSGRASCKLCTNERMACARENAELIDRRGYRFPLQRTVFPEGCILSVLGTQPNDLRLQNEERLKLGAGMLLHFTTEDASEQLSLTNTFSQILQGEISPMPPEQRTYTGHWLRGVD